MGLSSTFPPLYECGQCGAAVKVTVRDGDEPVKMFSCGHTTATIYANRKMTLRGVGKIGILTRGQIKITLTVRQFLSWLTGRSI
jgi:hypothetical protein